MKKILLISGFSFLLPLVVFADAYDDVIKSCGADVAGASSKLKLAILKSLAGGSDPCKEKDASVTDITSKCQDTKITCETVLKALRASQEKGKVIGQ